MKSRKLSALCGALLAAVLVFQGSGLAQVRKPAGVSAITPADMKEWLSYIASDQLQGRQVFTEGLGLAGSYIADHLKAWGVKPDGDDGSYFQVVKVLGVNVKRNSSVTVTVNGQTRTFKDGEGVTFPANAGGKQTVSVVGSDRISTELHNVNEESNAGLEKPMKLDYEMNDPADPESIYTRSDHYSYASKGIPIIFYTTGLHRDYHYVTDEVSKIELPKTAHIAQLVYTTGLKVANLDHVPARDNKGPRKGKGATGKIGG
ncbi:MAG TPA: M28 family peptidase [Vicinamibacterales bacterium]